MIGKSEAREFHINEPGPDLPPIRRTSANTWHVHETQSADPCPCPACGRTNAKPVDHLGHSVIILPADTPEGTVQEISDLYVRSRDLEEENEGLRDKLALREMDCTAYARQVAALVEELDREQEAAQKAIDERKEAERREPQVEELQNTINHYADLAVDRLDEIRDLKAALAREKAQGGLPQVEALKRTIKALDDIIDSIRNLAATIAEVQRAVSG